MSELNSLFIKVKIKRNELDNFFKSSPTQPKIDANWTQWWNSRGMYGKNELYEDKMYSYAKPDNQSIIESWINDIKSGGFSEYDEENNIWNFGIVFFGENYYEMIPGFEFIKSISNYIEDDADNFAIVFDFFWGGNTVNAYLSFKDSTACFETNVKEKSDIDSKKLKYVETYLDKKVKEFSKAFED